MAYCTYPSLSTLTPWILGRDGLLRVRGLRRPHLVDRRHPQLVPLPLRQSLHPERTPLVPLLGLQLAGVDPLLPVFQVADLNVVVSEWGAAVVGGDAPREGTAVGENVVRRDIAWGRRLTWEIVR